jgi:hypothetical protein
MGIRGNVKSTKRKFVNNIYLIIINVGNDFFDAVACVSRHTIINQYSWV